MGKITFLLTKDCMPRESLPVYGNKYWSTPNIDELAAKGTVFTNHYAAGASTAMSMSAMFSGHYPYEFKSRKFYSAVEPSEFESVFDHFQKLNYETHIIWDKSDNDSTWKFVKEFGDEEKTIYHVVNITQKVGAGKDIEGPIVRNDDLLDSVYKQIQDTLDSIDRSKDLFVWIHLPHVILGRRCYMDDIDAFDHIVGIVRNFAGDENIIISTDHGHMNMHKGLVGYGFHLFEPIIHIPLIAPRINGLKQIDYLTCNVDLPELIINRTMPEREYIISETQYYYQPKRKTAIVKDGFKYIYTKDTKEEELYDLTWDPDENYNILVDGYIETNRQNKYLLYDEYYFYPMREESLSKLSDFRAIKESFVYEPTKKEINQHIYSLRKKRMINKINAIKQKIFSK